ncbi:hypothetical protein RO3G_05496 [Rhizopus delemar RA 99-880]|uniref:Uncharacterized protein n=1 Tax=Rhizopus delemar (strain RA 99-880 / ATCC MYA-4621 / FGSC 9543 / NRRL 43880) TaxID=246409 RepID=I1BX61_RHIO9|nr:hypothetical protein RO3G_05496 [Rhizopus delemar RA 99-880]|eukprot:EIE80791.1 hypothetical protein RO3G_05496 [Rhizopus delemar RA 99-880]
MNWKMKLLWSFMKIEKHSEIGHQLLNFVRSPALSSFGGISLSIVFNIDSRS